MEFLKIKIKGVEAHIPIKDTGDGYVVTTNVAELPVLDAVVSSVFKVESVREHSRCGGRPFAKSAFALIADDLFFSVQEVAKYMSVSERTVYNMRYQAQSLLLFDKSFKKSIRYINNILHKGGQNADKKDS